MPNYLARVWEHASHKKYFLQFSGILLAALVFGVYANALSSPFIWDDEEIVVANPITRSWKNVPDMLATDVFGKHITDGNFYRPLQIFSYSLDYALWGLNPTGYHVTSIVIHAINAMLVLLVLMKLGLKKHAALLGAILFAVHPLHTESVTYISGRGDVLFLMFSLVSIICFINGADGRTRQYAASAGLFILALFSKESAIAVPFIMLAYSALLVRRQERRDALFAAGALCGIAFAYAGARIAVMGVDGASALSMLNDATLWQRLATIPKLLITYLRLLAAPHSLHMEYLFVETNFISPYLLAGIPFLGIASYLILKYVKPFSLSLFFLAWFIIGLAPFYNIFPVLSSTLREHWLYLSGIAFFALFALAATQALGSRNAYGRLAAIIAIITLIPYYAYTTVARNRDWKDPITLYSHDLRYEPKSFLLHNNLGVEHFRAGDMAAAKERFTESIRTSPGEAYDVAHNNLGAVLEREGDVEGAIAAYQHSILLGGYNMAYANLGNAYLKQDAVEKALDVLKEGANRYPNSAPIHYYLAIARFRAGQLNP